MSEKKSKVNAGVEELLREISGKLDKIIELYNAQPKQTEPVIEKAQEIPVVKGFAQMTFTKKGREGNK